MAQTGGKRRPIEVIPEGSKLPDRPSVQVPQVNERNRTESALGLGRDYLDFATKTHKARSIL
jgi:hypothetical protein